MTKSKMLSNDLENLETRYERKVNTIKKFYDSYPTESNIKIYENCNRALEQIRRLRALFEKVFR